MEVDHDVIIIGGGIVGCATAVGLKRRGVQNVAVYEKASQLHAVGAAIGLFPNGLAALQELSPTVFAKVQDSSICNQQTIIKDLSGNVVMKIDATKSKTVTPVYMVWYLLQQYFLQNLDDDIVQLGHVFDSYQEEQNGIVTVQLKNRKDNTLITKTCRVLVGADGIHSLVRTQLVGEKRELRCHGKRMFRAVMDITSVPPNTCPPTGVSLAYQGSVKGQLFAFRETAPGIMTLTSMALFPNEKESSCKESPETKKQRLVKLFEGYPKDVMHILDCMDPNALYDNAIYDLEKVEPEWSSGGSVVIIGDAAHAMTPGMGQGANVGLEDACELSYCLSLCFKDETICNIPFVLQDFYKSRLERVQKVHLASSNQTANVNKSSSDKPINLAIQKSPEFYEQLYNWKPTFVQD